MRSSFNRVLNGTPVVFPLAAADNLQSKLDEIPDGIVVFNPSDVSVSVNVANGLTSSAFGAGTTTAIVAGGFKVLAVGGGPFVRVSCTTTGAFLLFSMVKHAAGTLA